MIKARIDKIDQIQNIPQFNKPIQKETIVQMILIIAKIIVQIEINFK